LINKYGCEVLRLWVASSDFRGDVRISEEILSQLSESYRKIRNTLRFLLGNLNGFEPPGGDFHGEVQDALNRWAVDRLNGWLEEAAAAYQRYQFHLVVHGLVRLVTVDLSSFYLDVIKDRLYTLSVADPLRLETQKVLYYLLTAITRTISPVLVFTADEVYEHMPKLLDAPPSIHLQSWVPLWNVAMTPTERERFERLMGYRDVILKALEDLRARKVIGNSLQADVTLTVPADVRLSPQDQDLLEQMVMAARIEIEPGVELSSRAQPTRYQRCERCWRYTPDVGADDALCARCRTVLAAIGQ
jgi:isoleucyl-tRNA synthetase